ncbi:MAG: hypothetical protein RLN82_08540 [Pseudomonadales bacterium]
MRKAGKRGINQTTSCRNVIDSVLVAIDDTPVSLSSVSVIGNALRLRFVRISDE